MFQCCPLVEEWNYNHIVYHLLKGEKNHTHYIDAPRKQKIRGGKKKDVKLIYLKKKKKKHFSTEAEQTFLFPFTVGWNMYNQEEKK